MRVLFVIVLCIVTNAVTAQTQAEKLRVRMEDFHDLLAKPGPAIAGFIDDSLSYGHSNGWVESGTEFKQNLGTKLVYHNIAEDSVDVTVNGKMGYVRFNGDFDVSMNENRYLFKLKVLEVWVKRKKDWVLFARQAVRW